MSPRKQEDAPAEPAEPTMEELGEKVSNLMAEVERLSPDRDPLIRRLDRELSHLPKDDENRRFNWCERVIPSLEKRITELQQRRQAHVSEAAQKRERERAEAARVRAEVEARIDPDIKRAFTDAIRAIEQATAARDQAHAALARHEATQPPQSERSAWQQRRRDLVIDAEDAVVELAGLMSRHRAIEQAYHVAASEVWRAYTREIIDVHDRSIADHRSFVEAAEAAEQVAIEAKDRALATIRLAHQL